MVYYAQKRPEGGEEKPPGCIDALLITRAVFSVLVWPIAALFAVFVLAGLALFLFTIWPPLGLMPIALAIGAIYLYARWEQHHDTPSDL